MRVVTLLPAATEIVAALGAADQLVGVSHECDYPAWVQHLPRVTATSVDVHAPGRVIEAEVRRLRSSGRPVIAIDADQLATLAPDLIISQDLCDVCAVSDGQVHRLGAATEAAPRVISLGARNLGEIWYDIRRVGKALDLEDEADELVLVLESRLERIREASPLIDARVLCIEWLEPLYLAGHWVPDLVDVAGGEDVGARPGSHSARHDWSELGRLRPDLIIVMLCGFGVERARAELDSLENPEAVDLLRRVPTWIIDGNLYTSRSGPRVVDGAERIQSAIRGQAAPGVEPWKPAPRC